jgi:predicted metal-dependent TIM-barrel fold hydrolase
LPSQRHWKHVSTEDYAKAIRAVGAEHFVLSSDLGQYLNPIHTDGMKAFILSLKEENFTGPEIHILGYQNAADLLGLPD